MLLGSPCPLPAIAALVDYVVPAQPATLPNRERSLGQWSNAVANVIGRHEPSHWIDHEYVRFELAVQRKRRSFAVSSFCSTPGLRALIRGVCCGSLSQIIFDIWNRHLQVDYRLSDQPGTGCISGRSSPAPYLRNSPCKHIVTYDIVC